MQGCWNWCGAGGRGLISLSDFRWQFNRISISGGTDYYSPLPPEFHNFLRPWYVCMLYHDLITTLLQKSTIYNAWQTLQKVFYTIDVSNENIIFLVWCKIDLSWQFFVRYLGRLLKYDSDTSFFLMITLIHEHSHKHSIMIILWLNLRKLKC